MKIHSDLSGKEWIEPHPPQILEGWYLDVPRRIYIHFKHSGMVTIGARSQAWLPFFGYMPPRWYWWWFITYEPKNKKLGWVGRKHPEWYGLK